MANEETRRIPSRAEAGKQLAAKLAAWRDKEPIVIAMTRGGVPVGVELAKALGAELHVIVARKLPLATNPALALGAISEGGGEFIDRGLQEGSGVSERELQTIISRAQTEVARQVNTYRQGAPLPVVKGKTAILCDDGLVTGATLRAAISALKKLQPAAIIVAAGVASRAIVKSMKRDVQDVVCLHETPRVQSLAHWYADFRPVSDQDVLAALAAR
jgi:putative phosphoribosyl transferase